MHRIASAVTEPTQQGLRLQLQNGNIRAMKRPPDHLITFPITKPKNIVFRHEYVLLYCRSTVRTREIMVKISDLGAFPVSICICPENSPDATVYHP